ncbi:hypothetical protein Nhal_0617 [Nitrosococcus halophilus Nc 4]|uniref:Sulfotransferase n=1 Tax=Nitrosococcus halophilus (strain Nc4) TaxID=472759 RepID=D5BWR9_NITHN|nr:sulfotransferase [Nitrosococcus halophilus]ADE13800.1 hypothetical protein Nhal_0617 [Nitrosococcus halophilus Nc 4]
MSLKRHPMQKKVRIPNLFIIGAPKCGTTALSHYLAGHPMIFMAEQSGTKEPDFFDKDLALSHIPQKIRDWESYLGLFVSAPENVIYMGDASPLYLYSKSAVPEILDNCEQPRFIISLRNPIELAQSLHNQHVKNGTEIFDFEQAWYLQDKRKQGKYLPCEFTDGDLLQYGEVAKLGRQIQRLFQLVPRELVHVILYDDFSSRPDVCYRKLLAWLDLPDDGRMEFPRLNTRVGYRWMWLEQSLRALRSVRQTLGLPGGIGIHHAINRFNVINRKQPLSKAFREQLAHHFRDDVRLLEKLLGRDLSHWNI